MNADLDLETWLRYGVEHHYCSEPVCSTHDGLPFTDEELAEDDGWEDACVPAVRLYEP